MGIPEETEWRERYGSLSEDARPPLSNTLTQLLDGVNTIEEVYGILIVQGYQLDSIHDALHWLDAHKLLKEAPGSAASLLSASELTFYSRQAAALALLALPGRSVKGESDIYSGLIGQTRLKEAAVTLIGLGEAGSAFARALTLAGVGQIIAAPDSSSVYAQMNTQMHAEFQRINPNVQFTLVTRPEDIPNALGEVSPDLMVYCPDNFDPAFCEWLNRVCLEISQPLLLYHRKPLEIDIGPLILPRETACYICYDRRQKAAKTNSELFVSEIDPDAPRFNFPLGTDLLALEAIKFLSRAAEPVTYGRLWRMNLLSGSLESHAVLKLPRCPACGAHKVRPARKLWEEME